MRAFRIPFFPAASVTLCALVALTPARLFAQDASDPVPESEHPGSDSPESVTAAQLRATLGRKRAQAFLVPLDEKARKATTRIAQALEHALSAAKQYEVVDLAKELASDAEPAQEQKAADGRKLLADANQSFASHAYGEATTKYKAALKGLVSGLAALETHDIAEVYLRLAAAQQLSGEPKEVKAAHESYLAAALLDPQARLQASSVDPIAEQALLLARNDAEHVPIGKLEVETRPPGARVYIDGQPQGTSPTRVELTGGKHLLRLERTGFYPTAELVDVASRRETLYTVTLSATPGASTLNQLIASAADEAGRGRAGDRTQELAGKFHLDRLLIGAVSSHGMKVSLMLAIADPKTGQLLGRQQMLLIADGTDSDQLEFDSQEAARKLFALDEAGRPFAPTEASAPPAATTSPNAAQAPRAPPAPPTPAPAATAQAESSHRAIMPGSAPTAAAPPEPTPDEPGLVGKDRRAAAPGAAPAFSPDAPAPSATPAPAATSNESTAEQPAPKKDEKKKKKGKDLHHKDGTEGWDSN